MRVLCIDAKNRAYSNYDVSSLISEGEVYDVIDESTKNNCITNTKEPAYLLAGIKVAIWFAVDRFIVLSESNEDELVEELVEVL